MGLMDKIRKGIGGDSYDEAYDDYYSEFEGYDNQQEQNNQPQQQVPQYEQPVQQQVPQYQSYQPAGGGISLSGSALEMKVVKPTQFDSASQIADHLLNNRTVVLNLENTNKETARRLIDFLSGVAYSIDGSLKKIASNAYVITPNNVDVGDARLSSDESAAPAKEAASDNGEDFGTF